MAHRVVAPQQKSAEDWGESVHRVMVTGVRARGAKESVLCADKNRDGTTGLSGDLQRQMDELRSRSATMRAFMPSIFAATLVLAGTLVSLTIRRSILAPLARTQNELTHERDLLRIPMEHLPDFPPKVVPDTGGTYYETRLVPEVPFYVRLKTSGGAPGIE
jgi:hypothetical protein